MSYFRPSVDAMTGYQPGEQPAPGVKVIKLNTNENPYPPSEAALQVLRGFDGELLRRYPHPMADSFRHAASQVLGVPHDWILAGNGSDDILNLLVRACTDGDRKIVYPTPTYVLYETLAEIQDTQVVEVPYDDDYNLPVEQLIAANGAITFIASPNSPSGTLVPLDLLSKLASHLSGVLAIDEAYVDFADYSALELVKEHNNVIVLRTFSKGYSLAGLRLGFGVANPELLSGLIKVKDSYNVDAVACAVGAAAIADQAYKNASAERVKASRAKLTADLTQLGFKVGSSQANFVLAQAPDNKAGSLYQALKECGILVRYFKQPRLNDKLRITVGTEEQNQALIAALTELLA
jgi:histidinol-phosphate aminotransferase